MINITTPSVVINLSITLDESSPGTLSRLAKLESSMSAETDKIAEVDAKVVGLIADRDAIKVELADLKNVHGNDPEVIAALQAIEDKIDAGSTNVTTG